MIDAQTLEKARKEWIAGDRGIAYGHVCMKPRRIGNLRTGFRQGCGVCTKCRELTDLMRKEVTVKSLEELRDILAADVLDPEYPIEWVEEELRTAGLDPETIAKKGLEISQRLKERKKER